MPPSDDIKVIKDRRPTKADSTQKEWDAVYHAAAQCDPLACCLIELRDHLSTLQQQVDSGPKVCIRPATTADGLSPVEPAPQAPQGVTVEELKEVLQHAIFPCTSTAHYLFNHPRIGPLLRGEGSPVQSPVVLPEEPPALAHVNNGYATNPAFKHGYLAGWYSLRVEIARQQGGQADG